MARSEGAILSAFNRGDTLTISTASYKRRRFTVVEANGHRTVLRGSKGAHRVLVNTCPGISPPWYSIHEDDGEKNRGRPCTVDSVEPAVIALDLGAQPPEFPSTRMRARHELGLALDLPDEATWEACLAEVELMRNAATLKRHRPITAMEIALLMKCETSKEVAEWVVQRDVTHACVTQDQHAADNGAAMKLYLSSLEIRRLSTVGTTQDQDG